LIHHSTVIIKMSYRYHKVLKQGYILQNSEPKHCKDLEKLQKTVFPTLSDDEIMREKHYLNHIKLFPEGQFVILDGDKVIGMSTTIRYHLALEDHTFLEISDGLWMTSHEPDGEWLYGMDVGVHLDYRGQGLARAIYRARQETCHRLGLKGQFTVGMPNGYLHYADKMSLEDYYEALVEGRLKDPTVNVQQRMGFEWIRLIHNYLQDPQCGNAGILMVLEASKKV
jgi:GNAT superfamily N-acetyltransferase